MKTQPIFALLLSASLILGGCNGKDNAADEADSTETASGALQALTDKAKAMGNGETVDPVDFRKLKDLLPGKLIGLKRVESSGEKSGAMGFTVSTAQATYKNGDTNLEIEIVDTGGIAGVSTMALATWSMADIDKETATGYEKTTTLEGYKAFEKYDTQSKSGEINILVADRYVVNVEGNNLTIDQLKEALSSIGLAELGELK
ncbi:hypothetical protein [Dyadobacter sp. Leaf189]|uniref:hypothetical protein n=1 Tax=Dyadobacter sp. Leaf189 TaxID=1736295 RepID=UPI0006FE6415|nr:hypothetical protein [Dyadobacter sp. Leaf189]KQS33015.1 hypothetical protein ASG33_02700 [Dyadobacter sp. Leaf189]